MRYHLPVIVSEITVNSKFHLPSRERGAVACKLTKAEWDIYPIPSLTMAALYLKGKQCYDVFTSHSAFVSLQAAALLSRLGK